MLLLGAAHVLILIWLLSLGWSGAYVPVAATLALCSGLWSWCQWRRSGLMLRCRNDAWFVVRDGEESELILEARVFVSLWLVVIEASANGKRISGAVFRDSLERAQWRQLRAWLVAEHCRAS